MGSGFTVSYSTTVPIANGTVTYINSAQWGTARPLVIWFDSIANNYEINTLTPEGVPIAIVDAQLGATVAINVVIGNSTSVSSLC